MTLATSLLQGDSVLQEILLDADDDVPLEEPVVYPEEPEDTEEWKWR